MSEPAKAVFLSYASQDADAAGRICDALRTAGLEAWFDQSALRSGDAWDALIRRQIKECALFVPIISANTQAREEGYFRREWNLAAHRTLDMADDRAFLLPVVIDATTDVNARVPEKFREVQWTRLPAGETSPVFVERVLRLMSVGVAMPSREIPPTAARADEAAGAARVTPNNLPQQITTFVGRERELAEVRQLLGNTRFLTLVGVGGLGKTRLSLQVGAKVLGDFADGVWFVELAPSTDARLVPLAVASVLGVKEEAGRPVQEALAKHVRDRELLLILDNCEHLAHACAELAKELLQSGPQVKVVASSRESLHVVGETTYPLSTLAVPDPKSNSTIATLMHYEAVRLFCDRALAAQPGFKLSDRNAKAVVAICRRLDGIPLALELAAARVRSLSIEAIAERLSDRFHLLIDGDTTSLPRQQTLRGCIDWSYELLTESERALLQRLAVFAGGWTLEAAEAVGTGNEVNTSDVLTLLTHLVEKSLVEFDAASARYRMLETIREYVMECLQKDSNVAKFRSRHLDYFLQCAESAEPALAGGPDGAGWAGRLIKEQDNLRAAMAWSLEVPDSGRAALRMCGALSSFWISLDVLREGRDWCEAALRHGGDGSDAAAALTKTLLGQAALSYMLGDMTTAWASCNRALDLTRAQGERELECLALNGLGLLFLHKRDYASARAYYAQGLQIAKELGNVTREYMSIGYLAMLELADGNALEAQGLAARVLEVARRMRSTNSEVWALAILAVCARNLGDLPAAEQHIERALTISHEVGVLGHHAFLLSEGGCIAAARGDLESARFRFRQALTASRESGSALDVAKFVDEIAIFAADTSANNIAALLGGAVDVLRTASGMNRGRLDADRFDSSQQSCRNALGDEQYEAAREAGGRMSVEEVFVASSEFLERAERA
jgi:predicted ATPase